MLPGSSIGSHPFASVRIRSHLSSQRSLKILLATQILLAIQILVAKDPARIPPSHARRHRWLVCISCITSLTLARAAFGNGTRSRGEPSDT